MALVDVIHDSSLHQLTGEDHTNGSWIKPATAPDTLPYWVLRVEKKLARKAAVSQGFLVWQEGDVQLTDAVLWPK